MLAHRTPLRPFLVCVVLLLLLLLRPGLEAQQPAGSGGTNAAVHLDKPYVIVVSLDGFKAEYLDRFALPNLHKAMQRGARARAMVPVFPSFTFPNHFSLVTGLHPGRHGIVQNRFYDPQRDEAYAYAEESARDGSWYRGEPIWVTAEKQGMVAACFFWPGSEAAIQGVRPTIVTTYDGSIANEARVDTVLGWLRLPAERRPHVITLYFSELDSASHDGPLDSPAVEAAAQTLDTIVGRLLDGIAALPVADRVYVLLTSDHGMVETTRSQRVTLESLLDAPMLADLTRAYGGPVASLHVRGGPERARALRDRINARLARGTAYLRGELPARFEYHGDPRAGDVVVVMDESWMLGVPRIPAPASPPSPAKPQPDRRGDHGWDNRLESMRAMFLAVGPDIRPGVIVPEVRNVDVYPLMTELLGLQPAPALDGRPGVIGQLIRHSAASIRP